MSYWAKNDSRWKDGVYVESWMEDCWERLPNVLKDIAAKEMALGNKAEHVQCAGQPFVLLVLEKAPQSSDALPEGVMKHTSFNEDNCCFDGMLCTYQDLASRSVIAFPDVEYVDEQF